MKKLYRSFISFITFLSIFLTTRLAHADLCPPGDFAKLCELKADKAGGAVGSIVTILSILAIVLALIYLIYGGIKWITSGGDKAKVDAARQHITAAIIGVMIALGAFAILNIVSLIFVGKTLTSFTIPTLLN